MATPTKSNDKNAEDRPMLPKPDDKLLGPVLVFNERLGPYVCSDITPRPSSALPVGAGAQDPRERYDIVRIIVPPGLYLMSGGDFARCEPNRGFQSRVEAGAMTIVSDDPEISVARAWAAVKPKRAIAMIVESGHVPTFEAILEFEQRQEVRDALEQQIEVVKDESRGQQMARGAQRAHNRAAGRGRSRTRRMVN